MEDNNDGGMSNTLMRNNENNDSNDSSNSSNNNNNSNSNNNNNDDGGGLVIAIIDFPKGGTFGLDGQNIILKTNNDSNFIGVKDVPSNNNNNNNTFFHLVTCNGNGGTNKNDNNDDNNDNNNNNTVNTAVTVGFVIFGGDDSDDVDRHHLIRRYDPQTEEVSSNEISPVDEITKRNLIQQIPIMSMDPSRSNVLCYDQIIGGKATSNNNINNNNNNSKRIWKEQTRYINESSELLLNTIRGLSSGNKIVPGCYDPEDEDDDDDDDEATTDITNKQRQKKTTKIVDGISLAYPPIPVIDMKLSLAAHATKHNGTKRFLSRLNPSERTRLFLLSSSTSATSTSPSSSNKNFTWLERILSDYYHNSWKALLGDLQLSYLLFLHLGCYSSLDHWKDLLAMLSLAVDSNNGNDTNHQSSRSSHHDELYHGLLRLLPYQLSSMVDPEFLEDIDSIEGDGNFLLPTLIRLLKYYENNENFNEDDDDDDDEVDYDLLSKFRHVLSSKFPRTFSSLMVGPKITRIMEDAGPVDDNSDNSNNSNSNMDIGMSDYDDDDDDGPVVVSSEEIEASFARSSSSFVTPITTTTDTMELLVLRKEYPLLAAAIMPNEDVLMTCARALDEKRDVSLVREAAEYLQQVEQYHLK
jgi:hypothetical protein